MPDSSLEKAPLPAGKKKRLLIVSQHFWPENFRINDIVEGFVAENIEVDVLCGLPNYPSGEWAGGYRYFGPRRQTYKGADIFRSGEIRRKGNTSIRIFLNYVSFPFFALFNLPRLAGRKYDAVFCYETSPVMMMFPAIVYAKLHRIPLVTYVLDLWPDNLYSVLPLKSKPLRRIAQGVSNWHYRRSNKLIAMSDALALRLQEVTAGKNIDITVIPQYCEDFYAIPQQDDAVKKHFEKSFSILFAGNISPAQDLENLVDAMEIVLSKEKQANIRCVLVGDGMSRSSLEEYIQSKHLQHAFIFCGSHPPEDMPKWTTAADVLFAALSKSANLGLTVPAKITSYFAAGKPMLVAADGEAARAAQESGAALVSPASNPEQLAANILALYHMPPQQREQMGKNGFSTYQTHYSREKLLHQLQEFIL